MIWRGIIPQYLTFKRMNDALKKEGMIEMAHTGHDVFCPSFNEVAECI